MAFIRHRGEEVPVSPGETSELELSSIQTKMTIPGDEIIEKEDPRRPQETTRTHVRETVDVELTPTVVAKNSGEVDLFAPENTLEEMQ